MQTCEALASNWDTDSQIKSPRTLRGLLKEIGWRVTLGTALHLAGEEGFEFLGWRWRATGTPSIAPLRFACFASNPFSPFLLQ